MFVFGGGDLREGSVSLGRVLGEVEGCRLGKE